MKKILSLVLALILGFLGTNLTAAVADDATKTDATYALQEQIDITQATKETVWEAGYKARCGKKVLRRTRKHHALARRILLAPLMLFTIGDIVSPAIAGDKDVLEAKKKSNAWHEKHAYEEYLEQLAKEQAELDREAKVKAAEAARELKKAAKKTADEQKAAERKAENAKKAAEKLAVNKKMAWETSPVKAIELVRTIKAAEAALDEMNDKASDARNKRDEMAKKAQIAKSEAEAIAAGLKRPTSSSKYRNTIMWAAEAEAKLTELTNAFHSLTKTVNAVESEIESMRYQSRMIRKYGNAFARECLKTEYNKFNRLEKIKKVEENKNIRPLQTIKERLKSDSFTLYGFDSEIILKLYKPYIDRLMEKPDYTSLKDIKDRKEWFSKKKAIDEELKLKKRVALKEFRDFLKNNDSEPIVVNEATARVSRLRRSILSMIFEIDYNQKAPTKSWIVIEHGIQETFNISLKVFSDNKEEAEKQLDDLQKQIYQHIGARGVKVIGRPNEFGEYSEITYEGLFSSASHQKAEKLVMADRNLMKVHEEALWFGKTKEQILKSGLTGAEIWKMRANMARPISMALTTKDGTPIYLHDGKMVPDAVRTYVHKKALQIGQSGKDGKAYKFLDNAKNDVVVGAGAILMLEEMNTSVAQLSGCGLKGCGVDARSSETYALKKHKTERPDWLNEVKILFSEDCWKFDKVGYSSYRDFVQHMDDLAIKYPGINQVYVLRQGEEIEGEERVRTLTRSLLQQLVAITKGEIVQLTAPVVDKLNRMNSLGGMFGMAAELSADDEDRSLLGQLILKLPGLLLEPAVQRIYEKKWTSIKHEAMGNKARAKGQYPYITQDTVALYEIWALGMNPNRNDLGVLWAGEASLNLVKAGTKVVAVRFPANAMTAKVLECRPLAGVFSTCGNICQLSIYDDILIVQDGDVDGDEMCILYDKLLVKLVERMRNVFRPPVIMFAHGGKNDRVEIGTEEELIRRMYDSLWSAKRYDKVGLYANMSRDCAYLMAIQVKRMMRAKDKKERNLARISISFLMLWMAAASTGAILAIDQVKGNKVDKNLIKWLEVIKKELDSRMSVKDGENTKRCAPFTQPYVKADMSIDALPANENVSTDLFGMIVNEKTGEFNPDMSHYVKNTDAIIASTTAFDGYNTRVRRGFVTSGMLTELRYNYFNTLKDKDGKSVDADVFKLIREHKTVGLKELLELYWRNACSLQFRSTAKTVPGKKAEYQEMVRNSIMDWAMSDKWVAGENATAPVGYVFTDAEKKGNVLREAMKMALSSDTPSFTKFVLEVFAKDIIENVDANGTNIADFLDGAIVFETDLKEDCEATDFTALDEGEDMYEDDENIDLNDIMDDSFCMSEYEDGQ